MWPTSCIVVRLEPRLDERFGFRAVERHLAARLEQRHGERLVLDRLGGVRAVRPVDANVRVSRRARAGCSPRRRLLKARKLVASMPMSASRISPERGSTTVGPIAEKPLRAVVIQRIDAWRMSDVLNFGVVGLDLDLDRVLVADALERLVPFEHAFADRVAVLHRHACGRSRTRSAASAPTARRSGPSSRGASG